MSSRASLVLASIVGLSSLSGCLAPRAVNLDDKSCPCAAGWVCDTSTDTCIFDGTSVGGGDAGRRDTSVADDGGGDTGGGDTGAMMDGAPADTMMMTELPICVEAEDGTLMAPMAVSMDAMASGGSYVSSATGAAATGTPAVADGRVRFTVTVPADATYRLWGLAKTGPVDAMTMNNDPNSFWVCVDVDPPTAAGCYEWNNIPGDATWTWDDIHDTSAGDMAVDFPLTPGSHEIDVYTREANTQLDKILITDDLGFTPTGDGC